MKDNVTSAELLFYFDLNLCPECTVQAGPVVLGAFVAQHKWGT